MQKGAATFPGAVRRHKKKWPPWGRSHQPDTKTPEGLLLRLLLTRFPGWLLWRLRTEARIRKAARVGFTRPVDIPDAFIEDALRMTHRAFVGTVRAPLTYLGERSLPDRLTALGLPCW